MARTLLPALVLAYTACGKRAASRIRWEVVEVEVKPRLTWTMPRVTRVETGAAADRPSRQPLEDATGTTTFQGRIGTPGAFVVLSGSARWQWVVACQPRDDTDGDGRIRAIVDMHGYLLGDRVSPYLILGEGPGAVLDDFVARDRTGRFAAFIQKGTLWLMDFENLQRRNLSAMAARAGSDRLLQLPHGAVSFDPDASRLLFVRQAADAHEIVVLDLPGGRTWIAHRSPAIILRAWFEAGRLGLLVLDSDTDGNGRIEAPRQRTSLASRRCRGPVAAYSTSGYDGDRPTQRSVPAPPTRRGSVDDVESLHGSDRCLADGRPILMETGTGQRLVGHGHDGGLPALPFGPAEWRDAREPVVPCECREC